MKTGMEMERKGKELRKDGIRKEESGEKDNVSGKEKEGRKR
jgi:hypothetical protein